jgi:hypothetical protein
MTPQGNRELPLRGQALRCLRKSNAMEGFLIILHLELTFAAEKPPPAYVFEQVALTAAEESGTCEWRVIRGGASKILSLNSPFPAN